MKKGWAAPIIVILAFIIACTGFQAVASAAVQATGRNASLINIASFIPPKSGGQSVLTLDIAQDGVLLVQVYRKTKHIVSPASNIAVSAGKYTLSWDAIDKNGALLAVGSHYNIRCRLTLPGGKVSQWESRDFDVLAPPPAITGVTVQDEYSPNAKSPANIKFTTNTEGRVHVVVYNSAGKNIKTITNSVKKSGVQSCSWDFITPSSQPVADGRYRIKIILTAGGEQTWLNKYITIGKNAGNNSGGNNNSNNNGNNNGGNTAALGIAAFVQPQYGGSSTLKLNIAQEGRLLVQVYRKTKHMVSLASNITVPAGEYTINWDAVDKYGVKMAQGGHYYIRCRMTLPGGKLTDWVTKDFEVLPARPEITGVSIPEEYNPDWQTPLNITFNTSREGRVHIVVYNSAGKNIKTIINQTQKAGRQSVSWDFYGDNYSPMPAGKYRIKIILNAGGQQAYINKNINIGAAQNTVNPIWQQLKTDTVVINVPRMSTYRPYKAASTSSGRLGPIQGQSAGVEVLNTYSNGWSRIRYYPYRIKAGWTIGYVPTNMLKTVKNTSEVALYVNKSKQTMDVFKNGICVATFKVSTGKGIKETEPGQFLIAHKKRGFSSPSINAYCDWSMSINGNITIHEVPHNVSTGSHAAYEALLGTKASSGCIRVPVKYAKWLYDFTPQWSKIIIAE